MVSSAACLALLVAQSAAGQGAAPAKVGRASPNDLEPVEIPADLQAKLSVLPKEKLDFIRSGRGSRYVWPLQSRRSLLAWKISGRRTDGFSNDDFPIETVPGDPNSLRWKGQPVANAPNQRKRSVVGYTGGVMPPPDAVAGERRHVPVPLDPPDHLRGVGTPVVAGGVERERTAVDEAAVLGEAGAAVAAAALGLARGALGGDPGERR